MIGVDTNVLIRLFVVEEPHRAAAASFFGARTPADPAYIPLIVLAEFTWVLRRRYKYGVRQIGQAIRSLLDSDDFALEGRDRVEWALANYVHARIDFSDLLIARTVEEAGAGPTKTFDVDAAKRVPGMELLK